MKVLLPSLIAIALVLLSGGVFAVASLFLSKRSRKGRLPIGNEIKLLRQPGEGLREKLDELDEKVADEVMKGIVVPLAITGLLVVILAWLPPGRQIWLVFSLIGGVYVISLVYRLSRVHRIVLERRRYRLGLMGERLVAEYLDPLKQRGYHVYHDVPAQGTQKLFNLDHVVVGPTGVFVIETKTRTKANEQARDNDHRIRLDQGAILWPTGRDTESVTQACLNAKWLGEWLFQRLGHTVDVTALLVAPGYLTDESPSGTLRLLSHKRIEHHVLSGKALDVRSIDLVARQLESLCRTVRCEA